MTHCELLSVPREFRPQKTHFFSLLINLVTHNTKCICGGLLNVDEIRMKLPLKLT